MPMDYLRSIEHECFPLQIEDAHSLQCVRVLRAARLIEADIQTSPHSGIDTMGLVRSITNEGRVALAWFAQGKTFP